MPPSRLALEAFKLLGGGGCRWRRRRRPARWAGPWWWRLQPCSLFCFRRGAWGRLCPCSGVRSGMHPYDLGDRVVSAPVPLPGSWAETASEFPALRLPGSRGMLFICRKGLEMIPALSETQMTEQMPEL